MQIRTYDADGDFNAVERIWLEIGWIETSAGAERLRDLLSVGRCLVATLNGEAECMVHTSPGGMRYQDEDAPMCTVTAVTTSRVARRLGLAQQLTARQLATAASDGAELAMLGMFDQGFYDRLGFGTGSYDHSFRFDPTTLIVEHPFRSPKRLTQDDWRTVHSAMMERRRGHGSCVLYPPELMKAELAHPGAFGLGYEEDGELTHCIWLSVDAGEVEHGPYRVKMLAYRNTPQLLELLALLQSLGDQVSLIEINEPQDVQFQDLLRQPFRYRRNTRKSEFAAGHHSAAWWQLRILDLPACVARRRWHGGEVRFNLVLTDPIAAHLDEGPWRGCQGEYRVSVAECSVAEFGHSPDWPSLKASVNAFSRLWCGVAPASSLAITDDLQTDDPTLLKRLDEALRLPPPQPGWDF